MGSGTRNPSGRSGTPPNATTAADASPEQLFEQFQPWIGRVGPGRTANFLGVQTRRAFTEEPDQGAQAQVLQTEWPAPNEEYPGWINTLTAVDQAGETFTIAELGAGWGRWLVNGAVAARKLGKSFRLIGVEAEPKHFRWLRVHLRDNGIPEECATLHLAALAPKAGAVYFHVGEPRAWYGQTIAGPAEAGSPSDLRRELLRLGRRHNPSRDITRVPAVTLEDVIGDVDHVDLLDVDIQGAEAEVMSQARADLDRVVKRVHVRTHSRQIERSLRDTFTGLGWRNVHDFTCLSTNKTPWGRIKFQDGVQTWVNPGL